MAPFLCVLLKDSEDAASASYPADEGPPPCLRLYKGSIEENTLVTHSLRLPDGL